MATIRKRGARWQVQVRRQGSTTISKTFLMRSDAEAWGRQKEVEVERGEIIRAPRELGAIKVCDILRRYLAEVTPKKRGAVSEALRLGAMLRTPLAEVQVKSLKPSHAALYRDERLKDVSPSSVRRELAILQHCFSVAQREWAIPLVCNPLEMIEKPSNGQSRQRRPTSDEMDSLLHLMNSMRNPLIGQVFQFALATGMRRGEVLSLKWVNIDLQNRVALLPLTKNGEARRVPLSPLATQVLHDRLKATHTSPEGLLGVSYEAVFPISANAVRLAWERARRKAGIKDLRFHDLRHEAISRFFEIGLSVPEVALISGHKDVRMLFMYTQLRAENVAKKLGQSEGL